MAPTAMRDIEKRRRYSAVSPMSLCRESCGIVFCQKRLDHGYRFCDECPEYPCEDVMEKENRYMSRCGMFRNKERAKVTQSRRRKGMSYEDLLAMAELKAGDMLAFRLKKKAS